jgi:hypothetical protein
MMNTVWCNFGLLRRASSGLFAAAVENTGRDADVTVDANSNDVYSRNCLVAPASAKLELCSECRGLHERLQMRHKRASLSAPTAPTSMVLRSDADADADFLELSLSSDKDNQPTADQLDFDDLLFELESTVGGFMDHAASLTSDVREKCQFLIRWLAVQRGSSCPTVPPSILDASLRLYDRVGLTKYSAVRRILTNAVLPHPSTVLRHSVTAVGSHVAEFVSNVELFVNMQIRAHPTVPRALLRKLMLAVVVFSDESALRPLLQTHRVHSGKLHGRAEYSIADESLCCECDLLAIVSVDKCRWRTRVRRSLRAFLVQCGFTWRVRVATMVLTSVLFVVVLVPNSPLMVPVCLRLAATPCSNNSSLRRCWRTTPDCRV